MCPSSTTNSESAADSRSLAGELHAESVVQQRRWQWAIMAYFVALILAAALVDLCWPAAAKPLSGRHAEHLEEQRARVQWLDGTRMRLFEWDLRDTSRIREAILSPWAAMLFGVGRMPHSSVVPGSDGWLYLKSRIQPERRSTKAANKQAANAFMALQHALEATGTRLVLVPVPDKASVHPEHLPAGMKELAPDYEEFVGLCRRRGVRAVDVLQVMRAAGGQHFLRTDTHWTHHGARVTARAEMESLGLLSPQSPPVECWAAGERKLDAGDLLVSGGIDIRGIHSGSTTGKFLQAIGSIGTVETETFTGDLNALANLNSTRPWAHYGSSFSSTGYFKQILESFAGERGVVRDFIAVDVVWILEKVIEDLEIARGKGIFPRALAIEFLPINLFECTVTPRELLLPQVKLTPMPVPDDAVAPPMEPGVRIGLGEHALDIDGPACFARPGAFVHPADGSTSVIIEGEVLEGAPKLSLHTGSVRMYIPWPKGAKRLQVPIAGAELSEGFRVAVLDPNASSRVRIDSVRLGSAWRVGSLLAMVPQAVASSDGWALDLEVPAQATHGALLLHLEPGASTDVRVVCEERAEQITVAKPAEKMVLVLPLQSGSNTKWQLRGKGVAERVRLTRACLLTTQQP